MKLTRFRIPNYFCEFNLNLPPPLLPGTLVELDTSPSQVQWHCAGVGTIISSVIGDETDLYYVILWSIEPMIYKGENARLVTRQIPHLFKTLSLPPG